MNHIKEGDIYKIIDLYGTKFEIRYGYYDEKDRHSKYSEPIPIFPDFLKKPQFTKEGKPFVTHMQDKCIYYIGDNKLDSCYNCKYFQSKEDLIGICNCLNNKGDNKR